jgi:hypothetical protein
MIDNVNDACRDRRRIGVFPVTIYGEVSGLQYVGNFRWWEDEKMTRDCHHSGLSDLLHGNQ